MSSAPAERTPPMRHVSTLSAALIALSLQSCQTNSGMTSTEFKLAPPKEWRLASRSAGSRLLVLKSAQISNWSVEAELAEVQIKHPNRVWREAEGFGLPDVFEVLDEKGGGSWHSSLMGVRPSHTYIQLIQLRGEKAIICNFRLQERLGASLQAIEREVPIVDKALVRIAREIGIETKSMIYAEDSLLRIGDGWGVRLQGIK